ERLELRLHDPDEVIRDLLVRHGAFTVEADVHEGRAHRLAHLDHRRFGGRRQLVAHFRNLRLHLRERLVAVVVELQVDGDRAVALAAFGRDVVDAFDGRDGALDRRGNETLDQVRVRAGVVGGDDDLGLLDLRKLPQLELLPAPQAQQQDQQADDGGEHRPPDEDVGEPHQSDPAESATSLFTWIAIPSRSFWTPAVTTRSPGSIPSVTSTSSPREVPSRTKRCRATNDAESPSSGPASSTTNTASPWSE